MAEFVDKNNNVISSYDELQAYKRLNSFRLSDSVIVTGGEVSISTYFHGVVKPFKTVCIITILDEELFNKKILTEVDVVSDTLNSGDAIVKHNEIKASIIEIDGAN